MSAAEGLRILLLEIILRRYETRSTCMTSNRPVEEWGKLLHDVPATTAILDRFLHHAETIEMTGRSYRLHEAARQGRQLQRETEKDASARTKK